MHALTGSRATPVLAVPGAGPHCAERGYAFVVDTVMAPAIRAMLQSSDDSWRALPYFKAPAA